MRNNLRIILAEDEPAILRGLISAISQISSNCEIIGTALNGEDALDLICAKKPDVVITDIQMPLLNGLDLIEAAKEKSPHTTYIILTGYADFEYAKRAMKLNVTDYLLKPVDPDELEILLNKLKEQHRRIYRNEQLEYISNHLHSDENHGETSSVLSGSVIYLLFVFFGSVTTNMYNEISIGSQIAKDTDYAHLLDFASVHHRELYVLRGNYFNERILVFFSDETSSCEETLSFIREQIYPKLLTSDTFMNCILSESVKDGQKLPEHIRNCYLYAASNSLFGQNMLCVCTPSPSKECPICVTPEIEKLLLLLKPTMDFSDMESICHQFIHIWKSGDTSQFQIQTDLRCIFHAMTQKTGQLQRIYANPSELMCAASSYDDLFENMLLEFRKIYEVINTFPTQPKPAQQLAYKVRDYLDQHYTEPVSYKDFNDMFGYNEKYISLLFKEAFDISPSKYIIELRLTAAKNMMEQNPDALLKDIAMAVGYEDQLYFSRVFKNSEGLSPKAYQKKLTAGGS